MLALTDPATTSDPINAGTARALDQFGVEASATMGAIVMLLAQHELAVSINLCESRLAEPFSATLYTPIGYQQSVARFTGQNPRDAVAQALLWVLDAANRRDGRHNTARRITSAQPSPFPQTATHPDRLVAAS